ncbi:MAG: hypothetical protein D6712_18020, partial [Chloroflexi bacterium]
YRARDLHRDKLVALKVLHSHWAAQRVVLHRFRREAELTRQLAHPHIVPILDFGIADSRPYLVMPFMSGGSLAARFRSPAKLNLRIAARLISEVADALDFAHQQGVIHRDIKLENVLLDRRGRAYLSDFGIAHVTFGTRLTNTGDVTGTPQYMSPEQAQGRPDIGYKADLYSLAIMAYLLATGYYPFTAPEPLALLNQHLYAMPPLPTEVNPNLPLEIDEVLLRGLHKNPDMRYDTARDFANAYRQAIAQCSDETAVAFINIHAHNPIMPDTTMPQQAMVMPTTEPPANFQVEGNAAPSTMPVIKNGDTIQLEQSVVDEVQEAITESRRQQQHGRKRARLVSWLSILAALVLGAGVLLASRGQPPLAVAPPPPTATPTLTNTPSPMPSDTPAPTDTAAPVTVLGQVLSLQGVNMRQGAGTAYPLIVTLPQSTILTLIGRTQDSTWYEARTSDVAYHGWVFADAISPSMSVDNLPVTWQDEAASSEQPPSTAVNLPELTDIQTEEVSELSDDDGDGEDESSGEAEATDVPPTATPYVAPTNPPPPPPTATPYVAPTNPHPPPPTATPYVAPTNPPPPPPTAT